jgi:hypothetical protein
VSGILEDYIEDKTEEEDDLCRPREELEQAMREADNLENCEVYETIEDFIESDNKVINEIYKNKNL